jgi:hypothetical protein
VSNDGKEWDVIDRRIDSPGLNERFVKQWFAIQIPPKQEVRYVRLRQTGVNWANGNHVIICAFDEFGQLGIREEQQQ